MKGWTDGGMEREETGVSDCLDALLSYSLLEHVQIEKKTCQGVQDRGDEAGIRYAGHLLSCALHIRPTSGHKSPAVLFQNPKYPYPSFFLFSFLSFCVYTHPGVHVKVRGQFVEVHSLLPCGPREQTQIYQAWPSAPLLVKPSCADSRPRASRSVAKNGVHLGI